VIRGLIDQSHQSSEPARLIWTGPLHEVAVPGSFPGSEQLGVWAMRPVERLLAMAAVVIGAVGLGACGASAASSGPTPADPSCPGGTTTVTSQSQGSATGTPDLLTVTMGVSVGAPSAEGALGDDSARANALIASLHQAGVVDADIQTSLLSVQQTYSPPPNQVFTGYSVTNEVTVKLHDLTKAGPLIDQAAKAAGNAVHVDSIAYSISDDAGLARQARQDAVARATAQARSMAAGAGMHLGALCSVTDVQPQFGYGSAGGGASAAGTSGGFSTVPPVEVGTQQVSAQVTAVYQVLR